MAKNANISSSSIDEFSKDLKVWIPHNDLGWESGTVIDIERDKGTLKVLCDKGEEVSVPFANVHIQNPGILEGVDDMTTLSYLHEPAILHNLHTRYLLNIIYTYTGSILIAVNPYNKLNIYSSQMIAAYKGQPLGRLSPHVYAISEDAYRSMLIDNQNQSILVSGESGAGKTETTKFLLQYFAAMGESVMKAMSMGEPPVRSPLKKKESAKDLKNLLAASDNIEKKVLESTPLLEAFGNAKTIRNDNSSRFGKFIEIQFNESGVIIGARIRTYLLEKSRIVRQATDERNYHIFYQLTKAATDDERKKFMVEEAESYRYVNQSGCISIDDVDDASQFQHTRNAMKAVGITDDEQSNIFNIISAVLTLGNVEFVSGSANDSSAIKPDDETTKSTQAMDRFCSLVGCDRQLLEKYLISKYIVAGTDKYFVPLTPNQASTTRDALGMLLYSRLFEWLVFRINSSIEAKTGVKSTIGVLDIYGFEMFQSNSFEQMMINYANEKLQQQFNQHIFKLEQQEYEKEKIDWSYIEFGDNQECLDLLEKKPLCILSILDEQSIFPQATAQTLAEKLYTTFNGKSKYFEKPRFSRPQFTVTHYAGKVTYDCDTFIDKNKDYIVPEHTSLMQQAKSAFVKTLFQNMTTANKNDKSGKTGFVSVGSQFRDSLAKLMESIHATTPHYIRCIKPNNFKKALEFDKILVLQQLRSGGVLECIRISKAGYPTRRAYDSFTVRYKMLAVKQLPYKSGKPIKDPKKLCELIVTANPQSIAANEYQLGLTKIFLRAGVLARLEKQRSDLLTKSAIALQKNWRCRVESKRYRQTKVATLVFQSWARTCMAKMKARLIRRHKAATIIQAAYRSFRKQVEYHQTREATLVLQKGIAILIFLSNVDAAIQVFSSARVLKTMKVEQTALVLQTFVRSFNARTYFLKMKKATVLAQTRWRGIKARRMLTALRIEARSLQTVVAQKNMLEKKLEELEWKFSAEVKIRQKQEKATKETETHMEQLHAAVEKLTAENKQLQQDLHAQKAAALLEKEHRVIAELQAQELKTQLKRLDQMMIQKLKNVEDLANKEILTHKMQLTAAEQQYQTKLEEQQKASEQSTATLQAQLAELQEQLTKSKKDSEALLDKVAQLQKEREALTTKVSTLEKQQADTSVKSPSQKHSDTQTALSLNNNNLGKNVETQTESGHSRNRSTSRTIVIESDAPELLLMKTLEKIIGEKSKAEMVLVDLVLNRVISLWKDDVYNHNVFCSSLPITTVVPMKCLAQWNSNLLLSNELLAYMSNQINSILKLQKYNESISLLSYWVSHCALILHLHHEIYTQDHVKPHPVVTLDNIGKAVKIYDNLDLSTASPLEILEGLFAKMYALLLDRLYKFLKPAIHAVVEDSVKTSTSPQPGESPMKKLVQLLSRFQMIIQQNFINMQFSQQIFSQVFYYINCIIFNEVILRRDLCTWNKGIDLKMKLSSLKQWTKKPEIKDWCGNAATELEPTHQLASALSIDKHILSNKDVRIQVCPLLSAVQLKQMLSMYQADELVEPQVPLGVIRAIFESDDYNVEDQLCFDTSVLHSVRYADLHIVTLQDIVDIRMPKSIQTDLEATLIHNSPKIKQKNKSFFSFLWKDAIQPPQE